MPTFTFPFRAKSVTLETNYTYILVLTMEISLLQGLSIKIEKVFVPSEANPTNLQILANYLEFVESKKLIAIFKRHVLL